MLIFPALLSAGLLIGSAPHHSFQSISPRAAALMQTTAAPSAAMPGSPKELATQLSLAVQAGLADEHRKLEIRLPPGLCFGMFGPAGEQVRRSDCPGPTPLLTAARPTAPLSSSAADGR